MFLGPKELLRSSKLNAGLGVVDMMKVLWLLSATIKAKHFAGYSNGGLTSLSVHLPRATEQRAPRTGDSHHHETKQADSFQMWNRWYQRSNAMLNTNISSELCD
jgi:hypothetical protein